jgi:nitrogen regulatory protein PII
MQLNPGNTAAAFRMRRPSLGEVMKRIELVIEPSALGRFIETARAMNLSDFDVTEVRRSPSRDRRERQRLYRGQTFMVDLEEKIKIDINVADEAASRTAHALVARVNPESVAILKLDQANLFDDSERVRVSALSRENVAAA